MKEDQQISGSVAVKACSKCGEVRTAGEFHKNPTNKDGLQAHCKVCRSEHARKWWLANSEIGGEKRREHYKINQEKYRKKSREKYQNNREKICEKARKRRHNNLELVRERCRKWAQNNPECAREYMKERRRGDPLFRLIGLLRTHSGRVKSKFSIKSRTAQLLGCTFEQVQMHLILTALTNYGMYVEGVEYHIDHVIPLSSAKTEAEALALCHYTNLQYLTPEDNMAKSDRLDWELNNAS